MKILSLNQDKGIDETRQKGAAVHLKAIRKAFRTLGHSVIACDEPDDNRVQKSLRRIHADSPITLLYERYALGKSAGSSFAVANNITHVLEVNAPLAEEAARWRNTTDSEACRRSEHSVFQNATTVIAVSEETRKYSVDRGADPSSVTVCPNGFDSDVFYPRSKVQSKKALGISPNKYVVGFHGRLRPWHGFETLLKIIKSIKARHNLIHLLTVGAGNYQELLSRYLAPGDFTHINWINHELLGDVIGAYDVIPLMYSNKEPCYFSPLKLYEGMACGAVPIVPRVQALNNLVINNVSGLVYGEAELGHALIELYQNPSQLSVLRKGALRAVSGHTWRDVASETLSAANLQAVDSICELSCD